LLNAGDGWAAGEFSQEGVAFVAEILDADFAGEKAVGGEVAEGGKVVDGVGKGIIVFGVLAVCNDVEDFFLLRGGAINPRLGEAGGAGGVEPLEQIAEGFLVIRVFTGDQVNEFGRAGFDGAAGVAVGGDDGVAKGLEGFVLLRVEEPGGIRRSGLFVFDQMMRVFGGLERDGAEDGTDRGGGGEGFQQGAAGW